MMPTRRQTARNVLAGASLLTLVVLPAMAQVAGKNPDELATELNRRLTQDVAPLLTKFCVKCHEGPQASGDMHLDLLTDFKKVLAGDVDVRLVREMVGSGTMPPRKAQHPTDHERLIISQWLDAMINYVPADAPLDPGWFTIHRLNRTEYRNTLRDLLGIDPHKLDLSAKLPRDDTGYGFDNVADVLSTSPLAVEQYLDAAEQAIEVSLGPVVEFGDQPRSIGALHGTNGQPLSRGGFFQFANGPVIGSFTAPLGADYLIRIRAWETHAGDENTRIALLVGKGRVREYTVTGTREAPQEFEAEVHLKQGTHSIAVEFLNDYYVPNVADRNLGVESISIAGPLKEATTDRPPQWITVFSAGNKAPDDTARAQEVLSAFASRAYRRPASPEQVATLMKVYRTERESGRAFETAVRAALSAALVSPNFLFRSVAHPGASNPESRYRLSGYELASRLSYFLWSSMPDQPLLDAAADGSLLTDAGLSAHVKRMLADKRSDAFVENFSGQWLQLRALDGVAIDRARFPDFDDKLRAAMAKEATLFFGDVLKSDRSVLEFVDSRETFLNPRLAAFYGISGVTGDGFRRVTLPPDSPRGGVLTMGAVLTLTSQTTRTSPVKRGLFVLDQMLGAPPPPPPADVPPLEQAAKSDPNATVREKLAAHIANPTCAACHSRLDPLGLAFEHFDAIGRWRDAENEKPIDASGTLPDGVHLNGAGDLKRTLLARADQFVEALTSKVLTYALGRGVEPFDRPAIRQIARRTREQNDRFPALIEAIVLSETFRTCRGRTHD